MAAILDVDRSESVDTSLKGILKTYNEYVQNFSNGEIPLFLEGGYQAKGTIIWNKPANEKQISELFQKKKWYLPEDLYEFYLIHNGGVLFRPSGSGGGTELLSLEKIEILHSELAALPKNWYPIAWTDKVIGSICIDSDKCKHNQYPYLYFLDAMDTPDEAIPIHTDFTTWLNRLLVCQGEEYWLWDKYNKLSFK